MLVRGAHGRCKHRTQEVTQSSFLGQTFHSSSVASDQLQAAGNYTAGSGNGSNASMLQLPPSPRHRHPPPQSVGRRIRLLHPSLVGGDKEHEKSAMTHSRQ